MKSPDRYQASIKSAGAFFTDGTHVLLTRRGYGMSKHPGVWSLPGGRCEPGETLEQTALREAREELGHLPKNPVYIRTVRSGDYAAVVFEVSSNERRRYRPMAGDPYSADLLETAGWDWAPLSELSISGGTLTWRPKFHPAMVRTFAQLTAPLAATNGRMRRYPSKVSQRESGQFHHSVATKINNQRVVLTFRSWDYQPDLFEVSLIVGATRKVKKSARIAEWPDSWERVTGKSGAAPLLWAIQEMKKFRAKNPETYLVVRAADSRRQAAYGWLARYGFVQTTSAGEPVWALFPASMGINRPTKQAWRNPSFPSTKRSGICLSEEDDPNVLYHAAPADRIDSILATGLIAGRGETWSQVPWSTGKVFLAYGLHSGIQWQGMTAEQIGEDVALFEVKLPSSYRKRLHIDRVAHREGDVCTFYLKGEPGQVLVPPRYVSLFDDGDGTRPF